MIFITNKYTKYYYRIIDRAKSRVNHPDDYLESHHIIPKSFYQKKSKTGWLSGNADLVENLVNLTAREHMICHLLLPRMTTGLAKEKMDTAAWRTCTVFLKNKRVKINSRTYERLRKEHATTHRTRLTGKKRPEHAKTLTGRKRPDHAKAMSVKMTGSGNPRYGKPGTMKDKKHTQEALDKMRRPTGPQTNPRKQMSCACGVTCDASNFKKYGHGDNCPKIVNTV